jgi:hypothetical protein
MVSAKRIETLRMIVGSHPLLINDPRTGDVVRELLRVVETKRIAGGDRWLLQVLHTTRALDTCLARVVAQRGWAVTTPSLGAYLMKLRTKGVIVEHQRSHWQDNLVRPRNTYMHSANQMPPAHMADDLLNEMDACMSIVLGTA